SPVELCRMPLCMERIERVRQLRLASPSAGTRKLAETPTRFHVENIPNSAYILIPLHSSENRDYVPIGFLAPSNLSSNAVEIVPNATLYHFGVLTSKLHMVWLSTVGGRLKSDYRYSKDVVYNNYPWPTPTEKQHAEVERCAQAVLDARKLYEGATLGEMYSKLYLFTELYQAHKALDRAVEQCYRPQPFASDAEKLEFLFDLYQKLVKS
ncbi:MAG: methylase, partial [Alistipes sp.]|nr:methylase [Alistipes sp.]